MWASRPTRIEATGAWSIGQYSKRVGGLPATAQGAERAMPWWRRNIDSIFGSTATSSTGYALSTGLAAATSAATPLYTVPWPVGPLPSPILQDATLVTI